MSAPRVSRYPSTTHCCNARPPPRSATIAGSARFTTEPSRNATNDARTATATSERSVDPSRGIGLTARLRVMLRRLFLDRALSRPDGEIGRECGHGEQRVAHGDPCDPEPADLVGVEQVVLNGESSTEHQDPDGRGEVERVDGAAHPSPFAPVPTEPAPQVADDRTA